MSIPRESHTITRFINRGRSYLSHSDDRILVGLGDSTQPAKVRVQWPSGLPREEIFENLAPDHYHTLAQGQGTNPGS